MFWGVLIGILAAGVFGASIMLDSMDLMAMYTEMGIGVGIGVAPLYANAITVLRQESFISGRAQVIRSEQVGWTWT